MASRREHLRRVLFWALIFALAFDLLGLLNTPWSTLEIDDLGQLARVLLLQTLVGAVIGALFGAAMTFLFNRRSGGK